MARTRTAGALALVSDETAGLPEFNAMTAAAKPIMPNRRLVIQYSSAQAQAWDYWQKIGSVFYSTEWLANMISRVRLVIAEVSDSDAEPELVESGPAVEALNRLAGGVGGQTQLLKEMSLHLTVPGEGWLVGEQPDADIPNGPEFERWSVLSADEIRPARRKVRGENVFEVREGGGENIANDAQFWRPISPDSLVVRFWRPNPRFGWMADSPVIHALGALTELDLINARILATTLSRQKVLLYDRLRLSVAGGPNPTGPGLPADQFAQVLVDVFSEGIKDPASPSAVIPVPIGFEIAELTDVDPRLLMQVIDLSDGVTADLISQRNDAIQAVSVVLNSPQEVITGNKGLNDWSVAQISEDAVKINVAPDVELLANALTTGFLYPLLRAQGVDLVGPNGGRIVVWYDPSAITVRPDKSGNVKDAYDRGEVSGQVYRQEIGVGEEALPTEAELNRMILIKQALDGSSEALLALANNDLSYLTPNPAEDVRVNDVGQDAPPADATEPGTRDEPVPDADGSAPERA